MSDTHEHGLGGESDVGGRGLEKSLLIPPELPRHELVRAAQRVGGWFCAELERTYSGVAIQQWSIREQPPLVVELHEFHMFDTRVWRLRGRLAADLDLLALELPSVAPEMLDRWLADEDPFARMRALRALAVLGEPWRRAAEPIERALTDERAGMRWAALRVLTLARWPVAGELLRRVMIDNADRMPPTELLEQFADALDARRG
jgi:hypothetical protein